MLGISAAILVKGFKPPNLQGQFMPIMSRAREFSVWLDNCLPATVFVNNAPVYSGSAHLIHNLFCSHSRLEWEREKKKTLSHHFIPCYWMKGAIFKIVVQKTHTRQNYLLYNSCSSIAIILNSIHHFVVCGVTLSHWWIFFFFCCKYLWGAH